MRTTSAALLALLALPGALLPQVLAKEKEEKPPKPCTAHSPTTNAFFDLSGITLKTVAEGKKPDDVHREKSYSARGYDPNVTFALNFCAPVVEDLDYDLHDPHIKRENVSAYYKTQNGKIFSIGSASDKLVFRGRKLVLTYKGGSRCPKPDPKRDLGGMEDLLPRKIVDGDDDDKDEGHKKDGEKGGRKHDDDDEEGGHRKGKGGNRHDDDDDDDEDDDRPTDDFRRKSSMFSFLCVRDPAAPKAAISFVGTPDDCAYFFEVRTPLACEGASSDAGNQGGGVGPAGVFGLIVLITVAAYIIGGVAYQRTVMHQRGWRQLPNYGAWASIWGFLTDFVVIIFSSCSRLIPSRGGYNQLPTYSDRSRFSRNEDENRLIDQLDEEWDD